MQYFTPWLWFGLLATCLIGSVELSGQDRSNPFEITNRLPGATLPVDSLGNRGDGTDTAVYPPFAAPAAAPKGTTVVGGRKARAVLAIQLILLVALASLWVLFGRLLSRAFRGTLNDSVMNQLFTRRSEGRGTALWICHLFFFLSAGFYVHLFVAFHGYSIYHNIWTSWLAWALVIAGIMGLKQLVIFSIGRLFPISRDASKLAFVMMVFSILIGVVLVPINLGVSYAPEGARAAFLYGGLITVAGIYGVYLLRSLLVAGPIVFARPMHLILYICAIEIAPLLLLYRYLTDTLPQG